MCSASMFVSQSGGDQTDVTVQRRIDNDGAAPSVVFV